MSISKYLFFNLSKTVVKPNAKNSDQSINMKSWFEAMLVAFGIMPADSCCSNYVEPNSVTIGITATGTLQTDAAAITTQYNEISVGAANTGVILPVASEHMVIHIKNDTGSIKKVYPNTGAHINSGAANAAQTIATTLGGTFIATSATTWKYILT